MENSTRARSERAGSASRRTQKPQRMQAPLAVLMSRSLLTFHCTGSTLLIGNRVNKSNMTSSRYRVMIERGTAWRCQQKEVHKSQKNANTARHTNNQLHPTARTMSQTPENRQPVEAVNSAAWHAPLEMIQLRERQRRTTS